MAPGWMTSRAVYIEHVRPKWLDGQLEYSHKGELHLKNGHWDRFFDSMIGDKDCIFPELPRITHEGADGFTVSKRGQMELYSNLRLSQLPVSVNYGDLSRLTRQGYIDETEHFITKAKRLNVLEEVRKYRHDKLIYVLPARDDKDEEWNAPFNHFFGLIGVGGYGGHVGYVKVHHTTHHHHHHRHPHMAHLISTLPPPCADCCPVERLLVPCALMSGEGHLPWCCVRSLPDESAAASRRVLPLHGAGECAARCVG